MHRFSRSDPGIGSTTPGDLSIDADRNAPYVDDEWTDPSRDESVERDDPAIRERMETVPVESDVDDARGAATAAQEE